MVTARLSLICQHVDGLARPMERGIDIGKISHGQGWKDFTEYSDDQFIPRHFLAESKDYHVYIGMLCFTLKCTTNTIAACDEGSRALKIPFTVIGCLPTNPSRKVALPASTAPKANTPICHHHAFLNIKHPTLPSFTYFFSPLFYAFPVSVPETYFAQNESPISL